MIFDSGSNGGIFALKTGIICGHQALKLGEFAHCFRAQIRLGENHGAIHQLFIRTHNACDLSCEFANARNALTLRTQLGVEGHVQRIELGHALVERLRQIKANFSADALSVSRSGRLP